MKDGFIKVAAVTPKIRVADTQYNGELIRKLMEETVENGAKVVVFPELCITGYTCGDLFWQDKLIKSAEKELMKIADASESLDGIFFVGLPFAAGGKLYNVAAAISGGDCARLHPRSEDSRAGRADQRAERHGNGRFVPPDPQVQGKRRFHHLHFAPAQRNL